MLPPVLRAFPQVLVRAALLLGGFLGTVWLVTVLQRRLLPMATSFDTVFDRLGHALGIAAVVALALAAAAVLVGAGRHPLGERIAWSLLALPLAAAAVLAILRS